MVEIPFKILQNAISLFLLISQNVYKNHPFFAPSI